MAFASAWTAHAADPALTFAGSGTQSDPWQITSRADVLELARACNGDGTMTGTACGHYAGKYFILTSDIDMSGAEDFYGIATAPKGQSPAVTFKFQGNFDGKGHTIRNMTISGAEFDSDGKALSYSKTGSRKYCGFFGTLEGAVVSNLNIDSSCSVEGWGAVGDIAGQANAGTTITGCSSAAAITAYDQDAGGIVGYLNGAKAATTSSLTDCSFTGSVRAAYRYAGGIAGECNYFKLTDCVSVGKVEMSGFNAVRDNGKQEYGGGIAGVIKNGEVADCFNASAVYVAGKYAGGIVGCIGTTSNNSSGKISACVSIGSVEAADDATCGAIAGFAKTLSPSPVSASWFDTQLWSGKGICGTVADGVGGAATSRMTDGNPLDGLADGKWTYEKGFYPRFKKHDSELIRKTAATYVVLSDGETASDFSKPARISTAMASVTAAMAVGTEYTVANGQIIPSAPGNLTLDTIRLTNGSYRMNIPVVKPPRPFAGSGTEADPYLINDKTDFLNLASLCNEVASAHQDGKWFRQTADIDFKGVENFTGIAARNNAKYNSTPAYYFAGHYDGGGFTISNLKIAGIVRDASGAVVHYGTMGGSVMNVGLFGALNNGGTVENVVMDSSCSVEGYLNVGAIAGWIGENCKVRGCVNGATVVCYDDHGGGIVGYAYTSKIRQGIEITGCVNYGDVLVNDDSAGGIVGDSRGIVSDCVNGGTVISRYFDSCVNAITAQSRRAGGIAGGSTGDILNCLNLGRVYADSVVAGGISGFNSNAMIDADKVRGGRINNCINAGQVSAKDLTTAGAIVGEDFHTAGTETAVLFSNTYYDSQYSGVLGAAGIDKEGITPLPTDSLTGGAALDSIAGSFSWTAGYYPLPSGVSSKEMAKRIASTFVRMPGKETAGNFAAPATINTAMPLEASLSGSQAFYIEDGMVKTYPVSEVSQAVLKLANGDYIRERVLITLPSVFSGEGTETSPYIISTADDFNKIGRFMSESGFDFEDRWFSLTADIDFTNAGECVSAGSSNMFFNGTFEGNGHTLKNFKTAPADSETDVDNVGLFAGIGPRGILRNLKASGVEINANAKGGIFAGSLQGRISGCTADGACKVSVVPGRRHGFSPGFKGENAGGIAGYLAMTALIENCRSGAIVSAHKQAGGIAGGTGYDRGAVIANCVNEGTVGAIAPTEVEVVGNEPTTKYVDAMAGGIVGCLTGDVRKCSNSGTVLATVCNVAGGIVGKALFEANIDSCVNTGEIQAGWQYAGGIIGSTSSSGAGKMGTLVSNCENRGKISTLSGAGGIAGITQNGARITNSVNLAEIKASARAGGIVGRSQSQVEISDCRNAARITGSPAAGIVGDESDGLLTLNRCFNAGDVIVESLNGKAAGILNVGEGTASVNDCYNVASVSGSKYVGGITGYALSANLKRCYNAGKVVCTIEKNEEKYAGNISGTSTVSASNCYYLSWLPVYGLDFSIGEALTDSEMCDSRYQLGTEYVYSDRCLPRLAPTAETDLAKVYSVWYALPEGDSEENLRGRLMLGSLPGVEWKAGGMLTLGNGWAEPSGYGQGTLTASCGDFSRTLTFLCNDGSGVNSVDAEDPLTVRWFTPDGIEVAEPVKGMLLIRISCDSHGNTNAMKIIY